MNTQEQKKRVEQYLIITVVLIVSALANGYFQNGFSNMISIFFSLLASIFLALTIYNAAKLDK